MANDDDTYTCQLPPVPTASPTRALTPAEQRVLAVVYVLGGKEGARVTKAAILAYLDEHRILELSDDEFVAWAKGIEAALSAGNQ